MNLAIDGIFFLVGVFAFALLIVITAMRWRLKEQGIGTLFLYLAFGLVWNIGMAVHTLQVALGPQTGPFFQILVDLSRSAMPIVLGALTLTFLGKRDVLRWYSGGTLAIYAIWLFLRFDVNHLGSTFLNTFFQLQETAIFTDTLEIIVWVIAVFVSPWAIWKSLKQRRQAQFRNRIRYWFGAILTVAVANLLILLRIPTLMWLGASLNILGGDLYSHPLSSTRPANYHPSSSP